MKVLQIVLRKLQLLGLTSKQPMENQPRFRAVNTVGFVGFSLFLISESVFVYNANRFSERMESIYVISAAIVIAVGYTTLALRMPALLELIGVCETVIDERIKYRVPKAIYEDSNQDVEKLSRIIHLAVAKIMVVCSVLPKFIVSLIAYAATDLQSEAFVLPLPMWLPFDWKNLTGYLEAVLLQSIVLMCAYFFCACALALAIGCFMVVRSAVKDMRYILHSINKCANDTGSDRSDDIFEKLSAFVQLHSNMKQVVRRSVRLCQPIFLTILGLSLVTLCGSMLMVELQIHESEFNTVILLVTLFQAICALAVIFLNCEFGERTTEAFEDIDELSTQLDWYLFPEKIKRILPMTLINVQQPVEFACFGSRISCSRETFKKVINKAYSFFMVLRQFNN